MLIREKVRQAVDILEENSVDCWITFVRESSMAGDPMLSFLCASDLTWHSAFIITRHAGTYAIVGEMERKSIEDLGVYDQILSYVEGIRETFVDTLRGLDPGSILLNY